MNKTAKILLGILSFVPLVATVGSFAVIFYNMINFFFSSEPNTSMLMLSVFANIMAYMKYFILLFLILGIYFLFHIIQNPHMDGEKKMLWSVVLISFNGLVMPIYWYMHVWKDEFTDHEPI